MMRFSHVGLNTDTPREGEIWVEKTHVWVTDHKRHPYAVEWLRYAADSPVKGPVRDQPHVAFEVDDLEEASRGLRVLLEPWLVGPSLRVGFYQYADGTVVELAEDRAGMQ